MSFLRLNKHVRLAKAAACLSAAAALAVATTACSSDTGEKKYSVPKSLCGLALAPELLDPFLPAGGSVSAGSTTPNSGTKRCDVSVDGKLAVRATQTWWGDGENAATVAAGYDKTDGGAASDDDRFYYAGSGAVGKTASCTSPKRPDQDLYAVIQVFTQDRSDPKAMKKLITAYTKAIEQSSAC